MQSDASSTVVLLAVDLVDARAWQAEYPELASSVRVVWMRGAARRLLGTIITCAYFTDAAVNDPDCARVHGQVEFLMRRSPRGRVVKMECA